VVVVQHMPPGFTTTFAKRLDGVCPMRVIEAQGGERLGPGPAYIASGDFHMSVEPFGIGLRTALDQGAPAHHQRPAVDVLFTSVARLRNIPVVALLLTGMGADGAEEICVVFGMPRKAIAHGEVAHVASLLQMPELIFGAFAQPRAGGPMGSFTTVASSPPMISSNSYSPGISSSR
jgi:two-component system chemotaxis response regulator CheB